MLSIFKKNLFNIKFRSLYKNKYFLKNNIYYILFKILFRKQQKKNFQSYIYLTEIELAKRRLNFKCLTVLKYLIRSKLN